MYNFESLEVNSSNIQHYTREEWTMFIQASGTDTLTGVLPFIQREFPLT